MAHSFTFAVLSLMFFSTASAAPAGHQESCVDVQTSSLELNKIARNVSLEARKGLVTREEIQFSTLLVWMNSKDMCDPGTLKQESLPCFGKIIKVLDRYRSLVRRISEFERCSEFASQVVPVINKLHTDVTKCADSKGEWGAVDLAVGEVTIPEWEKPYLCHYILDRLFSFSIFTARVLSVGDPAHHTDGTTQKCM
ncbi:uncharacterized protein LOC143414325 [Maylandia zebra]|uniref:Uncharacterized protein n=1 Tax=Maylandia zebra TaxID=106582 RepID=A0A3P9DL03_9CICH